MMLDKACTAAQEIKGTLGRYVAYYTEEFDKANIRNEQLKRAVQQGIEKAAWKECQGSKRYPCGIFL